MNKLYNIMTAEELLDEVEGEVGDKIRDFFRELQVEIAELEASLEENEESIKEMNTAATASDSRIEDLEQMVDDLVAETTELEIALFIWNLDRLCLRFLVPYLFLKEIKKLSIVYSAW